MTKKVLVVEDDLLNRMFLTDCLRLHGYEVREADDGARVMDAVREYAPDLITMDINIPSISGETLIRRIKRDADLAHIPVLAITAFASVADEARVRGAGAEGFMAKPLTLQGLLAGVSELIEVDRSSHSDRSAA